MMTVDQNLLPTIRQSNALTDILCWNSIWKLAERIRFVYTCSDLGHPIIGDGRYGREDSPNPIGRLALHAFKLCFYHPVTGDLMSSRRLIRRNLREVVFEK